MSLLRYALLYHAYKLPLAGIIRFIIAVGLIGIILLQASHGVIGKAPLVLLSLFLMAEIMFRFKVLRTQPRVTVQKGDADFLYESFTLQALDAFSFAHNVHAIITSLTKKTNVKFIMHKANIQLVEIEEIPVSREDLAQKAYGLVADLEGKFVTCMDLFIAYLLLTEPKTHLLLKNI